MFQKKNSNVFVALCLFVNTLFFSHFVRVLFPKRNNFITIVLFCRKKVVFAVKNRALYRFIEDVKKSDTSLEKIKLSASSNLRGKERTEQIKKLEDYVYQVKAF